MFGYPPLSVTAHALWPKVCVLSCSLYTILKNLFSSPPSACLKRKLTLYLEKIYSIRVLYYLEKATSLIFVGQIKSPCTRAFPRNCCFFASQKKNAETKYFFSCFSHLNIKQEWNFKTKAYVNALKNIREETMASNPYTEVVYRNEICTQKRCDCCDYMCPTLKM